MQKPPPQILASPRSENSERDDQLIEEYLRGDEAALKTLISNHLKSVYNFIYGLVRNAKDAEDITQETFIKLWRHIKKYNRGRNFKAWLFRIARNTALDWLRKKRNFVFSDLKNDGEDEDIAGTIADPEPLPDALMIKAENKKTVDALLEKLSPEYREILFLYYNEDLTFNEIGQATGLSINTVKSRHRRALIALRRLLSE